MFDGPLLNERWRLGKRLGGGAQGHTYLARDTKADDERIVVVKQLHLGKDSSTTWKKFDLFEREVRVLRELDHPAIPTFLDQFKSDAGVFNLVMERAPGRSLSTEGLALNEDDLLHILRRVLEVLRYLHQLKPPVIHRDIKPANIVRAKNGQISLVDFGGVRAAVRDKGGSTVVGTFGYMAPEQLHGQATAATDLYGLGATIAALAGGIEPEDIPRKGLRMDLRSHLDHIDKRLVRMLEWMTTPDPDGRPQSADQVLDKLGPEADKALAAIEPVAPPATTTPAAPPQTTTAADDSMVAASTMEFINSLPKPLAVFLRILMFCIGTAGYLGFTVIRLAMVPLIFGIVNAFASKNSEPRIAESRASVNNAIDDARDGFRTVAGLASSKRKQLKGKRDDEGDSAQDHAK